MAQSFSAPAQVEAYRSEPILISGEWGARAGEAKNIVSIYFENPKTSVLVVSSKTEKNLENLTDSKQIKKFITESRVMFDLDFAEVTYFHHYSVDHQGKSWLTRT